MSDDRTDAEALQEGQVWATPDGHPMLYVRAEQRPGDKAPRHLFLSTRDRIVMERWHEDDVPFPERLELKLDPEATRRAREAELALKVVEAERDGLARALREAVGYVPVPVANELRRIFREAKAEALGWSVS